MSGSSVPFTEESFYYVCRQIGLSSDDLDVMNIGQALDHVQEWIENNATDENGKNIKQQQSRKATQEDFDKF